jgi:hypothetical protein
VHHEIQFFLSGTTRVPEMADSGDVSGLLRPCCERPADRATPSKNQLQLIEARQWLEAIAPE